ncbi:MAG: hypothetical protein M3177_02415, partial [Pseudomonadota bacterium]|nr:hypothetical protein [Pseudomonadota bacterium]
MSGRRGKILALGFLPFLWLAAAEPAAASETTDGLCAAEQTASAGSYPTSEALLEAAGLAERRLAEERTVSNRLEGALAALEVPRGTAAAPPTGEALARYCTAAGEVMRLSVEGSQLQAQNYLLTALREAQQNGLAQLTSQAAYRLGLVSLQGPPV